MLAARLRRHSCACVRVWAFGMNDVRWTYRWPVIGYIQNTHTVFDTMLNSRDREHMWASTTNTFGYVNRAQFA